MDELVLDKPKFEMLPTGKAHISFSELRDWQECSFRHKIKYVDKIESFDPSPILDFGTAVHSSCENYLKTKVMNHDIAVQSIASAFETHKDRKEFKQSELQSFQEQAVAILAEVPDYLEKMFPNWEYVDAEHALYEPLVKYPHAFKGFVDGIIKTKGKRGEDLYWVIDWKTTAWGWASEKKSNPDITRQLVFYKNFWSIKAGINPKNVRCGFVLLKRTAKVGSKCELITISVGDVTTERSIKLLNNMIVSLKRNIALKNKGSCTYCAYKNTQYCP